MRDTTLTKDEELTLLVQELERKWKEAIINDRFISFPRTNSEIALRMLEQLIRFAKERKERPTEKGFEIVTS